MTWLNHSQLDRTGQGNESTSQRFESGRKRIGVPPDARQRANGRRSFRAGRQGIYGVGHLPFLRIGGQIPRHEKSSQYYYLHTLDGEISVF